jgi:Na+/proline symporter/signal transduction histidine kinase
MFTPATILGAILLYVGLLFLLGRWGEKKSIAGRKAGDHPLVYSLSLAIYCTSWTYYGSVGSAATSGMFFLTIYLGPTLAILLWWKVLRKLIRLKNREQITSIADFIAARYGKSQLIAALATIIALVGIVPYIALQLKAVTSTFGVITRDQPLGSTMIGDHIGPIIVMLMILFTIGFGVRRLNPTERHQGMVMVVAVESLVKLLTFLAVGIFITYFAFNGLGDIFQQLQEQNPLVTTNPVDQPTTLMWFTYLLLSMSAILFLPRQFHITVVENSDENHLRTAMWLFPLYMLLICFFVYPLAQAGLLAGLPAEKADNFVLMLPLHFGQEWLALFVFIGGFSAATAMVMISTMTLATMSTNHLLLPVINWTHKLTFLRRHLLKARWAAVALVIASSYWFELLVGSSYSLVRMGIISFAAALQFAPPILGGLFWTRGNRIGAMLGLSAGFLIWGYTVIVPSFARSGWLPLSLLEQGPLSIHFLRPEQLFGLTGLDPLSHAVIWSMFFNIGLYVLGSLLVEVSDEEQKQAHSFVRVLTTDLVPEADPAPQAVINLSAKREALISILGQYFPAKEATSLFDGCMDRLAHSPETARLSVLELADLCAEVEKQLAGTIGAAAAHAALKREMIYTPEESRSLQKTYSEILAGLSLSPEDLRLKIDYYRDKEKLVANHAAELEEKIRELREQIGQRIKTEEALKKAQDQLRKLSGSIMAAQEQERSAIARELHDELGQVLTALRLDSAWLAVRLREGDGKAADRAEAMQLLIDKTIDEVRSISIRLRPTALDDLGLTEALEWLSTDFESRSKATCIFTCGRIPLVSDSIATAAFRITQESLTNITRYARASQVDISLRLDGQHLTLLVADNGRGFDPAVLEDAAGMGIRGMKERAKLLNGMVSIRSRPGSGTTVSFQLPVILRDGKLCAQAGNGKREADPTLSYSPL